MSKDELSNAAVTKPQWFITAIFYFLFAFVTAARSWVKARRAAPIWAEAGLREEIKEKWQNPVMVLRLLLEVSHSTRSLCHFAG